MSDRKLVSAVTGTWNRPELAYETIMNVREQTYRPLEHVIVADGPDPILSDIIARLDDHEVDLRFVELGFHSSTVLSDSISACPFMVAQLLAKGEYALWWADDERAIVPTHVEQLVDLVEQEDVDFAYPLVEMWWQANPNHRSLMGTSPPRNGTITHCLYRRAALDKGMLFRPHVGSGTDWDAVSRTMRSGASWAFLRKCTFSHRIDK